MDGLTREDIVALTHDEVLSRHRERHGNPYMPPSMVKEMQREELKWFHLGAEWKKAQHRARERAASQLREKVFSKTSHD